MKDTIWTDLTPYTCKFLQKTPMKIVEEEEEEVAEIQPDPLQQLILHFSHNALTERRCFLMFDCRKQVLTSMNHFITDSLLYVTVDSNVI